jgi:serine/threonine protein kinase/Flp pilus assembly protein TadD/TolB-like protein
MIEDNHPEQAHGAAPVRHADSQSGSSMTPERWEQAKKLFEVAQELDPGERTSFLNRACPDDPALRGEVESLLSSGRRAGEFLAKPVLADGTSGGNAAGRVGALTPGQVLSGRFRVIRFLGEGGMGEVYEARDLDLGERVALKAIRPEIASEPHTMARFKQEIQLARRVTHSNVCRMFDLERHRPPSEAGPSAGVVTFLTMELLEGETLAARLRRVGRITTAEAFPLVQQMAQALAAAHEVGVVHRDFKPGNVMLVPSKSGDGNERAVVTDFGLAKAVVAPGDAPSSLLTASVHGHMIGTIAYIAPEQLRGGEATPASDIYALGLVMYEMVAGKRPFPGDALFGGAYLRLTQLPESPRVHVPDLDRQWEQAILRCLEVDPAKRFANARGLVIALSSPPETISHYRIMEKLGVGGTGVVYRAEDTKLKREVALKRVTQRWRADARYRQRLLLEAQHASPLNNPHIANIYEVVEEGNELFVVLEYVEGVSLRERLRGRLPMEEFLGLAIQSAEGLVGAHEKGVLHLDIKPEDIMLTPDGKVKLLDFGVAKVLPDAGAGSDTKTETQRGFTSGLNGTPGYMAPEVLAGKELDGRADVFSLGAVFYEALTHQHPFRAWSFAATCDRVLHEDPARPSTLNPLIPLGAERIVLKMLAKDAANRYASAVELLADLRSLSSAPRHRWLGRAVAMAAAAAVLIVVLILWYPPNPITNVPQEPKLALLLFSSADQGPEGESIARGIRETLGADLTQMSRTLHVIPPVVPSLSVDGGFQDIAVDSPAVARQVGANLTLQGSVDVVGNRVRVRYEVAGTSTNEVLAGAVIDGDRRDLFELQDRVARNVVAKLKLVAKSEAAGGVQVPAPGVHAAYEPYVQARGLLRNAKGPSDADSAAAAFRRALGIDPNYAPAYAGLGEAYLREYQLTKKPELVAAAIEACQKATIVQGTLAEGHTCLGHLYEEKGQYQDAAQQFQRAADLDPANDEAYLGLASTYERLHDSKRAEETYLRAVNLQPHNATAHDWLGMFYIKQLEYGKAEAAFRQALDFAPDDPRLHSNLGWVYFEQGLYSQAAGRFQRSVELQPTGPGYSNLATAYFFMGQFTEAARVYENASRLEPTSYDVWGNLGDGYYWASGERAKAADAYNHAIGLAEEKLEVNPNQPDTLGYLAQYYAMVGDKKKALDRIDRALRLDAKNPDVLFNAALVHQQFGERDAALHWLEKAVESGYPRNQVRDHPAFFNLHNHGRFKKLIQSRQIE